MHTQIIKRGSFNDTTSPVLNTDMLGFYCISSLVCRSDRNGQTVKLVSQRHAGQFEESRRKVSVRRGEVQYIVFCDSGATNDKWDVDIFFNTACFPGGQSMLSKVETVISGVDYVGVGQNLRMILEGIKDVADQVVHSL